ncbi:MAG: hypothetical protein AAFU78_19930, partial [Cyanobacteria bacterium J06633_2]
FGPNDSGLAFTKTCIADSIRTHNFEKASSRAAFSKIYALDCPIDFFWISVQVFVNASPESFGPNNLI